MLNFPVAGLARPLLTILLAAWAALLIFGLLLGAPNAANTRRLSLAARMGMSILLVLSALIWWRAGAAPTALAAAGFYIFLGMSFGLLGDLFMANVIPTFNRVIFGILAFGAGHIFYILAMIQVGRALGLDSSQVRWSMVALYLVAAVLLWWLLARSDTQPAVMNFGTLGYSLLLAGMAGLAMSLAVQEPAFLPLALGGLLFLLSDLILGNQIMRDNHWPFIDDVIWTTYTVGQMLIVFSLAPALRLLTGWQI